DQGKGLAEKRAKPKRENSAFSTDDAVCYSEFRAMRRFGHLESARLCFKLKLEPQSIYLNHVDN
ncbi:unnamed protein product, partial [Larinioides sclopetarius]